MNRSNSRVVRKERRRDRRRGLQLEATLGDQSVLLTDISAAGFGVAIDATVSSPFDFRPGQRLHLEILHPSGRAYPFQVEIIRPVGANGVLGGLFVDLSDEGYNVVESILVGRFQRGR